MISNSKKILSLLLVAAAAFIVLMGMPSSTSDGATHYVLDGSPGKTWNDFSNNSITLNNGDSLTIDEYYTASPSSLFKIQIAADANVTIKGHYYSTLENVYITESSNDTVPNTITFYNFNSKVDNGETSAYYHYKGVLNCIGNVTLEGANGIVSNTPLLIKSPNTSIHASGSVFAIGNGKNTSTGFGIVAPELTMEGITRVTGKGTNAGLDISKVILKDYAWIDAYGDGSTGKATTAGCTIEMAYSSQSDYFGTRAVFISTAAQPNVTLVMTQPNYYHWVLRSSSETINASFVGGSTTASSPATVSIPSGVTIYIFQVPPLALIGPTSHVLTEGYGDTVIGGYETTGFSTPDIIKVTNNAKVHYHKEQKKMYIYNGLSAGTYEVVFKATGFTAPETTFTFTLYVVPGNGQSEVTGVKITPSPASVAKGGTLAFAVTVEGANLPLQDVTWSVSGNNNSNTKISSAGVLTVAAAETATTLAVKASSTEDPTKFITTAVTVTGTNAVIPPVVSGVSITPAVATVKKGDTGTFYAVVFGNSNISQTVTWSVLGNSSPDTKINADGVLTVAADETASALTVKATSHSDATISKTASVTIGSTDTGSSSGGGISPIVWVAAIGAICVVGAGIFFFMRKP